MMLISLKYQIFIFIFYNYLLLIGVCAKFPIIILHDYYDEETETWSKIDMAPSILRVVETFQPYFLTRVFFDILKKKMPNATSPSDRAMPEKVFLLFIRRRKGK